MAVSNTNYQSTVKTQVIKSAILLVALFVTLSNTALAQEQETVILQNPITEVGGLIDTVESVPETPIETPATEDILDKALPVPEAETLEISPTLTKDQENQLQTLDTQLAKGEITKEEYELQKQAILSSGLEASALRVGDPINPESQTVGRYVAPSVSAKDGSLTYEYGVAVPPGRDGLQPDLKLVYDSNNKSQNSIISLGWSFNIPFIQRLNKQGVDKLYTENHFMSSLDGELVSQGGGIYEPMVENGTFLRYQFANDVWTVTAKDGTQYSFGLTAQSKQANPTDATKVFVWMLEKVTDTNGNTITYTYFKDQGQIYPDNIKYNQENSYEIRFARVARTSIANSFVSGFLARTAFKINKIEVYSMGTLTSRYDLTFTADTLDKIQMTGLEGGQSSILPETQFLYTAKSGSGWYTTPAMSQLNTVQFSSNDQALNDNARQHIDINGDGLADNVWAVMKGGTMYTDTKLGTGTGFVTSSSYTIPTNLQAFFWNDTGAIPNLQLTDANGDGLLDLAHFTSNAIRFYFNNGAGWSTSPNITHWYQYTFSSNNENRNIKARQLADINGDGITDILWVLQFNGGYYSTAHLGTGTGFVANTQYVVPAAMSAWFFNETWDYANLQLTDANGDGLLDLAHFTNTAIRFYFNKGAGWNASPDITHVYQYTFSSNNEKRNILARQLADINGDGITDILWVLRFSSTHYSTAHLGTGTGFVANTQYVVPTAMNAWFWHETSSTPSLQLTDTNGDGLLDLGHFVYGSSFKGVRYYLNNAIQSELLRRITEPTYGETDVTYQTAQKISTTNAVHFALPVVQSITTNDKNGTVATSTYAYIGADFYYGGPLNRKFAGFSDVTKTNPDGSKIITKYHQANGQTGNEPTDSYAKIGKPYEEVTTNSSGSTWLKKRFAYTDTNIGTNATSSLLTSELTQRFDGTSNRTDTATTYTYDTYGNVATETKFGVVTGNADGTFTDTGSDKRTIESTYVANTNDYIVGLPKSRVLKNNGSTQESRTNYHYDVDGNLLEEGRWVAGTDYATTTYTYNSYGLTTSEKDALNNTTTYTYDTNNLYPATITKPLSQATTYTYDYSSGKPKTITDPNGKVIEYIYDGLDRLLTEKRTIGNGTTEIVRTRAYATTANPQYVTDTLYRGATDTHESRTYIDGFGREIQKKVQYAGGWATTDMVYDNMGRTKKVSLPYHTTSNAKSAATTNNNLLTVHTHDPLGRILTTTDARGVTTMVYSGLTTTVTDAESNTKEYTTDAFNNLVQVKEFNNTTPYTTQYTYNTLDLLTNITDAEGNVRGISYDGLGRRTSLQDLHAPADGTYGTYTFSYDDINLLSVTSPNGDVTSYTYDALNRALTENSNSTPHTDVTYTYDSCTNGIGYVCQIATSVATTSYTYYKQGIENTKTVTLDGTSHTQSTTYNRQNQPITMTYPNSDSVAYTYTVDGLPASVSRNSVNFATATYGVHSKPLTIVFANGLTTTNTYNANKLYELASRLTENTSSTDLQNLAYTYDNVGNILSITDTSVTDTKKTQSFTYDDLYRLTGVTTTNVASGTSAYTQSFAYSPVGNITNFNGTASTYAGTSYANPHAATTIGGATQTYDNNGNLTNDGVWTHAWDYRNRLTSSTNGSNTATYQYNHKNARTKLTEAGETTYSPFSDYEITSGIPKLYLNLGDTPIATIEGATTTYLHTDHLGGTTLTTNPSGVVTQTLDYFPYGDIRLDTGTNDEDTQFTGYKKDDVTGLNYAGARYYNSARGRFISQDPVYIGIGVDERTQQALRDPQMMNSYGYARNNPLAYKDPDGEWAHIAIGAGAGILGQYGYDVYSNIQSDGFSVSDFTSNLSSPKTYATRAVQGAAVAATGGAVTSMGAVYGVGTLGQSVAVGSASGIIGAGGNAYLGEPVTLSSVAVDTTVGGLTFGASSLAPRVPGRMPNFGTNAFYTGKHTQQSAVNLGVDSSANYLTAILNDLSVRLRDLQRQSSEKQQNKKEEKKQK